eukprot:529928-Rhodomonas_salina.1
MMFGRCVGSSVDCFSSDCFSSHCFCLWTCGCASCADQVRVYCDDLGYLTPGFCGSQAPLKPDDYLPSVMTCANYLKLPVRTRTGLAKLRSFALTGCAVFCDASRGGRRTHQRRCWWRSSRWPCARVNSASSSRDPCSRPLVLGPTRKESRSG